MMEISQVGINLIKSFEGCRLTAYKPVPTEEHWTIGWGHYGPDIREHQKITQKQADDMLLKDLQKYVDAVNHQLKVKVNQYQFDALVSFCYNCGPGALKNLTTKLNKHDFDGCVELMMQYVHSGKKVLQGLVRRREAEKALFLLDVEPRMISILKPINLWKDVDGKLEVVRVLQPDEKYKVYGYRDDHGGQYNVGSGHWITKMEGYVKLT